MSDSPTPPAWVVKRDGRQVPFEADKISRALFAVGEDLGRPDAFLARELTDGVVHFLAAEAEGGPPTTRQIADLVVKVVRELGQPALAERFAERGRKRRRGARRAAGSAVREGRAEEPGVVLRFRPGMPPAEVLAVCAREYTLQAVFARDLVAAQADGLLTLTGLEAPGELDGYVLAPRPPWDGGPDRLADALESARRFAGGFVALDGPEYGLLHSGRGDSGGGREFVRELAAGLRAAGLRAVVNLNSAAPPAWADDGAGGPLFDPHRPAPTPGQSSALADSLARELIGMRHGGGRVRLDWHLTERDFAGADATARLLPLTRAALDGAEVAFAFDRPRGPVPLAEGVDRQHPAALLTVGLHLPRLAELGGVGGDAERFLLKLGSLARLALSAAVQKRAFLRQQAKARSGRADAEPALTSGFLLDRARLVTAPVGLDAVVRSLSGSGLAAGGPGLELGRRVVGKLRDVLRDDGRRAVLDACVDGPAAGRLGGAPPELAHVAGLTPWGDGATVREQLRGAGPLHAAAEGGTLTLFIPPGQPPTPEEVVDWLRAAWQRGEVVRVRLSPGSEDSTRGPTPQDSPPE